MKQKQSRDSKLKYIGIFAFVSYRRTNYKRTTGTTPQGTKNRV